MLFLSRGMWGWARTLAAPSLHIEPGSTPSLGSTAPTEREGVIRVLATMAIVTAGRSSP